MIQRLFQILSFLLCLLIAAAVAFAEPARITGSAEVRYAEQSVETGGVTTLDANHFVQQYSVLWSREGEISRGRLGKYDLALGYEWSWVDTEVNGVEVKIDNPLDKILYRGDLTLAPGGLPFRMNAYSYDMHHTTFDSADLGNLFKNYNQQFGESGIITDINNGSHIISGITLVAGVKNGHYQGRYRDLLATLPRLLIDYKQQDSRDVKGPNPRDYVDRDLAFVSLNKKNNWFHYRRFDHEDHIDSTQNYDEETYLLGTIDHNNRRQWVALTNWIKVSSDLSYSERNSQFKTGGLEDSKRYDVNFFAKASRTRWQLDNFTSFTRLRGDTSLDHSLDIPFFARGELNRDIAWRFQLVSNQFKQDYTSGSPTRERDNIFLKGQVDTYRQARYIVRPEIALESKSGTEGEGVNGKASVELFSNPLYRNRNETFARYSIGIFDGTSESGLDASFFEQMLMGRMETSLSSLVRVGGEQQFVYGTGEYDSSIGDNVKSDLESVGGFNGGSGFFSDDIFRSTSTVFVELTPVSGMRNRVELKYDFMDSAAVNGSQIGLSHRFDYTKDSLTVAWSNSFVTGDGLPGSEFAVGTGSLSSVAPNTSADSDFSSSFASNLRLSYIKGRSSRLKVNLDFESFDYDTNTSSERVRFDETYEYSVWHVNGKVRKILVLGETGEYDKTALAGAANESLYAFSLFSNYYPTSHSLLSARLRYEYDDVAGTDTLLTFLSAGLTYSKLQVSLDYSYGRRDADDTNPEQLEHKWEVRVKKTF